jgi:hypothetical protein
MQAAQKTLPAPPAAAPVEPEAPGPYSFASEQRVARILGEAGFTEVSLSPVEVTLDVSTGDGVEGALALALVLGPSSRLLEKQSDVVRSTAADLIRDALAPYVKGDAIPMDGSMWIVTARNP